MSSQPEITQIYSRSSTPQKPATVPHPLVNPISQFHLSSTALASDPSTSEKCQKVFKTESAATSNNNNCVVSLENCPTKSGESPVSNFLPAKEEEKRKVVPVDDFLKMYPVREALAYSANQPKHKLKGVWVIEDLDKTIEEKETTHIQSPEFILPNGNQMRLELHFATRSAQKHEAIGLYFCNLGTDFKAEFSMYVKNVASTKKKRRKQRYIAYHTGTHEFNYFEKAWGNAKFLSMNKFEKHELGDLLRVQFVVKCIFPPKDPPKGCATGLINHGTTCYANSLIQTLNSIKEFRKAIWAIPTKEDEMGTTEYALQRVFYNMQTKQDPVGTKELLYTFGWKDDDFYIQHDIQEFKCLLSGVLEKVEPKLASTPFQSIFKHLFEGRMTTFIQCTDIDCKSSKTEAFTDLSLNVRGCRNIYDSFEQYLEKEEMSGDNSYFAEEKGFQKAHKMIRLDSLPPILSLHLKRFKYESTSMSKINDHYEFFEYLDLTRYCSQTKVKYEYKLHSVIVHRGDPQSGHYFAFVLENGIWVKYDDRKVAEVSSKQAIQDNFGGYYDTVLVDKDGDIVLDKKEITSSAYLLIYIRVQDYDAIQENIVQSRDIPLVIKERFELENHIFALHKEETERLKNKAPVYITTAEMLKGWERNSVAPGSEGYKDIDPFTQNPRYRLRILTEPSITLSEFLNEIADRLCISIDSLGVWVYEVRKTGLYFLPHKKVDMDMQWKGLTSTDRKARNKGKPKGLFLMYTGEVQHKEICIQCKEEEVKRRKTEVQERIDFFKKIKREDYADDVDTEVPQWKWAKEVGGAGSRTKPILTQSLDAKCRPRLVFIKYYDPDKSTLTLLDTLILSPEQTLSLVEQFVKTELKLPEQLPLEMREELNPPDLSYHKTTKKLKADVKAEEIKEVSLIICSPSLENPSAKPSNMITVNAYLKTSLADGAANL